MPGELKFVKPSQSAAEFGAFRGRSHILQTQGSGIESRTKLEWQSGNHRDCECLCLLDDGISFEEITALRKLSQAKLPDFQPQLEALGEALSHLQSLELQEDGRIAPLTEALTQAAQELRGPAHETPAILAARQAVSQAEHEIWALVTGSCPTPELAVAWEHWHNTKNREGGVLLYHLHSPLLQQLREDLCVLSGRAQERLKELGVT